MGSKVKTQWYFSRTSNLAWVSLPNPGIIQSIKNTHGIVYRVNTQTCFTFQNIFCQILSRAGHGPTFSSRFVLLNFANGVKSFSRTEIAKKSLKVPS